MKYFYLGCFLISAFFNSQITVKEFKKTGDTLIREPNRYTEGEDFSPDYTLDDYDKFYGYKIFIPEQGGFLFTLEPQIFTLQSGEKVYTQMANPKPFRQEGIQSDYAPYYMKSFKILKIYKNQDEIYSRLHKDFRYNGLPLLNSNAIYNTSELFEIEGENGEKLYYIPKNFIFEPFFDYLKKKYNGKVVTLISKSYKDLEDIQTGLPTNSELNSNWNAEVVVANLNEDYKDYKIYFILTNDKKEKIAVEGLRRNDQGAVFITKDDYDNRINNRNLAIAAEKEAEQKKQKEHLVYKNSLIAKYGETKATAILNKDILIGMLKEECILSWGKPYKIQTNLTEGKKLEKWFYFNNKYLVFGNNKLIQVIK